MGVCGQVLRGCFQKKPVRKCGRRGGTEEAEQGWGFRRRLSLVPTWGSGPQHGSCLEATTRAPGREGVWVSDHSLHHLRAASGKAAVMWAGGTNWATCAWKPNGRTRPQGTWVKAKWSCRSCCLLLSCVWFCVTPWTAGRPAALSMGFPRREFQSGRLLPSPGNLPDPLNSCLLHWQTGSLPWSYQGSCANI